MDAYPWSESVLSTRSLSYISTAGSLAGSQPTPGPKSVQPSLTNLRAPSTRRSTLTDFSEDGDLEMADAKREKPHDLKDIPELPDSVANSLLFELPREIRDRIYHLCLAAQGGVPVEWPVEPAAWRLYKLQTQLLRVCKIVHDEAAPLLYTLNRISFHHPSDANVFVRVMASRTYGHKVSQLSLHIKAQDMRIWMPYLTSTDQVRSLKADFPSLKELHVRFRSNRWMHALSPELNLKNWSEDSRLDELIDGLRHVFFPRVSEGQTGFGERDLENYMLRSNTALQDPQNHSSEALRKQLLELQQLQALYAARREAPVIRISCACRVHPVHFTALTNPAPEPLPASDGEPGRFVPRPQVAPPVLEGEPFPSRGFSPIDLQNGVKKLHDSDLGTASVARTPFADKHGILLSLEISCLDSRREAS